MSTWDDERAAVLAHVAFRCQVGTSPAFYGWQRFARGVVRARNEYRRHHHEAIAGSLQQLIDDMQEQISADELQRAAEFLGGQACQPARLVIVADDGGMSLELEDIVGRIPLGPGESIPHAIEQFARDQENNPPDIPRCVPVKLRELARRLGNPRKPPHPDA